jgi:hypothetical protein
MIDPIGSIVFFLVTFCGNPAFVVLPITANLGQPPEGTIGFLLVRAARLADPNGHEMGIDNLDRLVPLRDGHRQIFYLSANKKRVSVADIRNTIAKIRSSWEDPKKRALFVIWLYEPG